MGEKHSRYSPSGAYRWMVCPGSVDLSEKCKKTTSKYAQEGTRAHKLGEFCLINDKDASEYVGAEIDDFTITEEMAEAVQVYLDTCREEREIDDYYGIEEAFDLSWLYKGIFGTNDFYRYNQSKKKLTVIDYKHGRGVAVDAVWNPQLMLYALGAIKNICDEDKTPIFDNVVQDIEIIVVQPRALHQDEPVKRWHIKAMDLMFWAVNVVVPCAIRVDTKSDVFVVGEHCKFCEGKVKCETLTQETSQLAQVAFDEPTPRILPHPDNMDAETISKILTLAPVISKWADEVENYALNELENGMKIPGFKLVKRQSRRRWLNEDEAAKALLPYVSQDKLFKVKLQSIAQVEKLKEVKDLGKGAIDHLWEKPDTGYAIAPETDKRAEQDAPAIEGFSDDLFLLE